MCVTKFRETTLQSTAAGCAQYKERERALSIPQLTDDFAMCHFDKMPSMNEPNDEVKSGGENEVVMYGSNWCSHTQRALGWMKEWNVEYRYVDVDKNPEAEKLIASWNEGRAIRPTFEIGGAVFVNPDTSTLQHELRSRGLLAE